MHPSGATDTEIVAGALRLVLDTAMQFTVDHIGLPARDPQKLKDWYVGTLDGKLVYADGKTPPAFFVALVDDIEDFVAHVSTQRRGGAKNSGKLNELFQAHPFRPSPGRKLQFCERRVQCGFRPIFLQQLEHHLPPL